MKLFNLFAEAEKHVENFKSGLEWQEIDESTEMADLIAEYADGQYVYYWDQWSVAVACRFDSGDYGEAWETANDLVGPDGFDSGEDHINAVMAFCAQEFVQIALREQFSEYEIAS